jgi:hypothetical protein
MAAYTIYVFDEVGLVVSGVDVAADTTNQAMGVARTILLPGQTAEVWSLGQMVGKVSRRPANQA